MNDYSYVRLFPHSGLGIGTTPAAFVAHGIETTIVEIDPAVHRLALQYFNLPRNHTAYLQDAVLFVRNALLESRKDAKSAKKLAAQQDLNVEMGKYDYVVHDVFTGGAEPVDLFTLEFIQGLHDLLKHEGVIAIVSCVPIIETFVIAAASFLTS